MFKGLITKAVKDMVVDPIMNPQSPKEAEIAAGATAPAAKPARSEFDPEAFDQATAAGSTFDPDSFDSTPAGRSRAVNPAPHRADPVAARSLMNETWDIDLPFFPGEGTACGIDCECSWMIERHGSIETGGEAIFATWMVGVACSECQDCLDRAAEWTDVFVRPASD